MKVVINTCYGGFGLSAEAYEALGVNWEDFDGSRSDPRLIEVVEALGEKANGESAFLKIVKIPDDVDWYVDDFNNGNEIIRERHRTWSYQDGIY